MGEIYKQHITWEPWVSTGYVAASATIKATPGLVGGIIIVTDGTNAATVLLRDGGDAGDIKAYGYCVGTAFTYAVMFPSPGVRFDTDIYATLTGTGANVIVLYK